MTDVVERDKITDKLWKLIRKVEEVTGAPVTILNTGKPYKSIIDLTRAPGKVFDFALQVAGV
jgi:adenylosuccinate synthase